MYSQFKRIFSRKRDLHQEPFCPYYTDESGQQSLQRNSINFDNQPGATPHARPSYRDGKRHS